MTPKSLLVLLFLSIFSCKKEKVSSLQLGNWGGEHVRLEVMTDSWYLEFDCAHAMIDQGVLIKDGKFEIHGGYVQETGVFLDDPDFYKPRPAKFTGELKGNTLNFKMYVGDDLQDYGSYTVIFSQIPKIFKCA